jgi:acetyl esterase/lipase
MPMIKTFYIFCFVLFFGGLLYHFVPLKIFNLVINKDKEAQIVAKGIPYGADPEQLLDVYRPKKAAEHLHIVIFVHGGSWKDGYRGDYEFAGRAFAAKGYLTFVMSYRLLPKNTFPSFVQDIALATAWAAKHGGEYGGEPTKMFMVGHSAGGYNIALAVLDSHYMRDAGVDTSKIKGIAIMAAPLDFLPLDSPITMATFGEVADLPTTQPINFARVDAPPFLLLHGTADTTVYPRNSRSMFKHLSEAGAHPQLKEYQGVSHVGIMLDLAVPLRRNAPVLDDIDSFFKNILK